MDVEAEILHLRRRVQALEAGAPFDEQDMAAHSGADAFGEVLDVELLQRGMADDLQALSVEVTGLRWQTHEHYTNGQAKLLERLDDIRSGMHHLDLKLDQLLKKDTV